MSDRARSLTDWLLLRAWIEPDHERKLRVVVMDPDTARQRHAERRFADADAAAACVREWLVEVVARWEAGERSRPGDWLRKGHVKDGRRE